MRYEIRHANVSFAANKILEDINFLVNDGEHVAVIGRNGCGKTTLLKLINGDISMSNLDSDEACGILKSGVDRIGYLRQINFEDHEISARNEIMKVFEPVRQCQQRMHDLEQIMRADSSDQKLLREYAHLQEEMEALHGYTCNQDLETMFQRFGFPLTDLAKPMGAFSGGQQTKISFIKLLLSQPDIMLLDEPTNHLDMPTIEWLEGYLRAYKKAVVIVSHDRMFLDRVVDVTYEIEYHKIKRYRGNYSAYLRLKEEAQEKQQKDYEAQQEEIARLTQWIEKWKNTPTKVAATRSKRKVIEHMVMIEKPRRFDVKAFQGDFEPRITSYSDVIIADGLQIGYDQAHVLSKVTFTLHKGERMAVIGENGKGKSTLLKTLVGDIDSLSGRFSFGQNVEWEYFDQQAAVAEPAIPEQTVMDYFWDIYPKLKEVEVRSALGAFLFSQKDVFKEMGKLSGGEKVRLSLCIMFKKRPNLLILDEPTNHMDLVGKEALGQILLSYSGTVLFVSHDRYFISEVATGILDFQDRSVNRYECGYDEYQTELQSRDLNQNQSNDNRNSNNSNNNPTLSDVFDKKTYYNPGKIMSRLKQQLAKYEQQLSESEERLSNLQMQQMDPALASDFEALTKIDEEMKLEEANQESLLERMLETELELEKMGAQQS